MPLVDGGAHTVLPLYPGMMIRRSKGRILRDGSGAISPQPRARAVSSRAHARVLEERPDIGAAISLSWPRRLRVVGQYC